MAATPLDRRAPRPAPMAERRAALRAATGALGALAERVRPTYLAKEELFPVPAPLAELLGTPGLRRGSTLLVEAERPPGAASPRSQRAAGATSLALALLAEPTAAGAACAVVGLPDLGLIGAQELGVALERVVLVPDPGGRSAAVVGALLDGVDVVLVRFPAPLPAATARRLSARARERRAVLVLAGSGVGDTLAGSSVATSWPDAPDVRLAVAGSWERTEDAPSGLLGRRRLVVTARRRRAAPEELCRTLALAVAPGGVGGLALSLVPPGAEGVEGESAPALAARRRIAQ